MTLSIILPVYNVADYIGQCIQSVVSQCDGLDVEIILADDCATDDSVERALRVVGQCPNLRVVRHERNRGLSAARNTGLGAATGDYVIFIDSDDVLADGALAALMTLATKHPDADVVVGQFDEFEEVGAWRPSPWRQRGGIFSGDIIGHYLRCEIPVTAWNKLCRREFLLANDLRFEEGLVHEDALWSLQVACCARKVVVADAVTYHYRQRSGSLDKQVNAALHLEHYARVTMSQTRFVFARHMERDRRIYGYIDQRQFQLLADAFAVDEALAKTLYHTFRQSPNWSLWQRTLRVRLTWKVWLRALHWSLPEPFGFWALRRMCRRGTSAIK